MGSLEERVEQRTRELKEALQQQTALAEVFKEISGSSFDLQKLLDRLVDLAARLCTADSAHVAPSGDTYQSRRRSAIGRSTGKDWIGFLSVRDRTPAWVAHCWSDRLFTSSMCRMILICITRSRPADMAR